MLNRCDFRCVLKVINVRDRRRSTGRLLRARGPATARARSPMVERDRQQNGQWNKTLLLQAIFSCFWRNKLRMDGCYCRCRQVEVRGKHSLETGQTVSLADA